MKKHMTKFFSKDSKFYNEHSKERKLVLSSSSVALDDLLADNVEEQVQNSVDKYKEFFSPLSNEYISNFDVIMSNYFMKLEYHLKDIKFTFKQFEAQSRRSYFEKKYKALLAIVNKRAGENLIICCNDSSIELLKYHFNRRKLQYVAIDDSNFPPYY